MVRESMLDDVADSVVLLMFVVVPDFIFCVNDVYLVLLFGDLGASLCRNGLEFGSGFLNCRSIDVRRYS